MITAIVGYVTQCQHQLELMMKLTLTAAGWKMEDRYHLVGVTKNSTTKSNWKSKMALDDSGTTTRVASI